MHDFKLVQDAQGRYSLADTTDDISERVAGRVTVQLLSQQKPDSERGSLLAAQVATGQVRTNADFATIFSISASGVVSNLNTVSYDITPVGLALSDVLLESFYKMTVSFEILTIGETVVANATVGTP